MTAARSEAQHAFGDAGLILEKALVSPRHVEIQVFADMHGNVVHMGERDCSVQRRHQKLIEESPSPAVDAALRARMGEVAVTAARAIGYRGAGTLEFLLDAEGAFHFMEMNTRLQVEHAVTEAVLDIDLVEWQLRVAAGEALPLLQEQLDARRVAGGHAIEVRLCAEDARRGFLPQSGTVLRWLAQCVRDAVFAAGQDTTDFIGGSLLAQPAAGARSAAPVGTVGPVPLAAAVAAVAAVLLAMQDADPATRRWPAQLQGWSNSAPSCRVWRILLDGEAHAVPLRAVGPETWEAGGALLRVARAGDGGWRAETDGVSLPLHWTVAPSGAATDAAAGADPRTLYLMQGGADHVALQAPPAARRAEIINDGRITAPMNGRIAALPVAAGETVKAGQVVAVIEAMKMEHSLLAPFAGVIEAIHGRIGEQASPGQLLLRVAA